MGEADEKEAGHQTEEPPRTAGMSEDSKETEKLLTNNDNDKLNTTTATTTEKSQTNDNKIESSPKSPSSIKLDGNGDEVVTSAEKFDLEKQNEETSTLKLEEREVKPKKIPIGGLKLPGFFMRNKPKGEGDGADGELLENQGNEAKEEKPNDEKSKDEPAKRTSFLSSLRFRNRFSKRQPLKSDDIQESNVKGSSKDTEDPTAKMEDEAMEPIPQPKKGLLNAIRLPIANMIPKKLKPVGGLNDDVELGNGPSNKAGLASMETLDDSLKDQENGVSKDVTDRIAPCTNDTVMKPSEVKKSSNEEKEESSAKDKAAEAGESSLPEKRTVLERIRAYHCSVDDLAIIGGLLIFILLVILISAFVLVGKTELKSPPIRDGKFIQAVTSCGPVEGLLEDSAFAFRGIPYAVPPIDENRWRPAKLIDNIDECWNGTFRAHNATPPCLQIIANGTFVGIEDCLNLDVITPHVRYDNPLPVIVLIGAESLNGDSPSKLRPSARYARAKDVIFVRPNFRVGVMGFLALDVLSRTTHPPTSGNYGITDLIAVLQWIQLNIEHFGGDPKSVTLWGHRAGGTLVSLLVTSRTSKDLFARAWVSSGAAVFPGRPLPESERANYVYLNQTGCQDAACLRSSSNETLLKAVPDTWRRTWLDLPQPDENTTVRHEWLVLDGQHLQKHPAQTWDSEWNPMVKMVIGTTAHESHSDKVYLRYTNWTTEQVRDHIDKSVIGQKGLTDKVLSLYNATYQGLVKMISDIRTICPLLVNVRLQPSVPFYVVTQPGVELQIADIDADIQAILGRYEPKTPEQRRYVSAMQQLFYHYVSHGEIIQFERRKRVLDIGQDALPIEDYPNCNFWIKHDIVPRYARID